MTQPYQPGSRDPYQPFGQPAPAPVSPSQFTPPPNRRPLWITLAVLALIALAVLAATRLGSDDDAEPQAAPTESVSTGPAGQDPAASTNPTVGSTPGTGIPTSVPFENPREDTAGTFEVVGHRWTSEGLLLTLRVTLDRGQQRLGFFALDNASASQYDPSPSGQDYLEGQPITAGQSLTGTVLFAKPQGETTVFLAGTRRQQLAALKIAG
ncbi:MULTISPECIES: hypothetical protein [unclassified Luteococcus]|uniref:hypothetical protein n=1 Tax=unclassified Luteococcus TaxID=2639923 RepID=UPI00313DB409